MNLTKFGIIIVVAGLLAFLFASETRKTALLSEEERNQNFQPGHVSTHLTPDNIKDDIEWQEWGNAGEMKRHEKKLAEIEDGYWSHVVVAWLVCAGIGFGLSGKSIRAPSFTRRDPAKVNCPPPPQEPAEPVMVTCKCNACSGEIQFNEDGFDYHNPPTVSCPHCGQDTLLYIPTAAQETSP